MTESRHSKSVFHVEHRNQRGGAYGHPVMYQRPGDFLPPRAGRLLISAVGAFLFALGLSVAMMLVGGCALSVSVEAPGEKFSSPPGKVAETAKKLVESMRGAE